MDLENIQNLFEYQFDNLELLRNSLVHRSYLHDSERDLSIKSHNERLEFLGDAVLELVVTDYLFRNLQEGEGKMTALRSSLVNHRTLEKAGTFLGLENIILLSRGEKEELGKARSSIVADAVEAVIGAIYLDGGYEQARKFIEKNILSQLPEIIENKSYKDPKTQLQEYAQKHFKQTPFYRLVDSEGKDHEKTFVCGVWIGNRELAKGEGNSKQIAETQAAEAAFEILREEIGE